MSLQPQPAMPNILGMAGWGCGMNRQSGKLRRSARLPL